MLSMSAVFGKSRRAARYAFCSSVAFFAQPPHSAGITAICPRGLTSVDLCEFVARDLDLSLTVRCHYIFKSSHLFFSYVLTTPYNLTLPDAILPLFISTLIASLSVAETVFPKTSLAAIWLFVVSLL